MPRSPRSLPIALVAAFALSPCAKGQLKLPQESPAATISLDVGVSTLTVSYHRPALRGRDLAKDVAAAGKVWRLGANEATTFTCSDPFTIGGKPLPAGTYALFAKVEAERWTFVLNQVAQQWGSYFYDEKKDVARFDAKVERVEKAAKREWFTIALEPAGAGGAELAIAWDDVRVAVPIRVDVEGVVAKRIEEALAKVGAKDWTTRKQVAQYWCTRKEKLEPALKLIEEAVAIEQNPWTLEWKGRILHELDDEEPAIPWIEKALAKCEGTDFPEGYREGLRVLIRQWKEAGAR
jgi:tetratricopeptide (TPR) repeat protein